MTDDPTSTDVPPGVRVMCDGGTTTVTKTATADAVVTREVDGDDTEMLRVPISSTRPDREGDRFAKEALEGMAEQIREEQPLVFQNHGIAGGFMDAIPYDQSETIGTHMDAEVDESDDGEYDLYSYINPDGTHEEGTRMLKQVRDEKQAIKFSVGFEILGKESREEEEPGYQGEGRQFTSVDLMEDSKVGIPANPDATVTHSAEAKSGLEGLPGYQKHPLMQMMQMMGSQQPTSQTTAAKDLGPTVTDGGEPGESDADEPTETDAQKAECPECGEDAPDGADYCPNCGEEMGEDGGDGEGDDDEDDDEEDSTEPTDTDDADLSELRAEVAELREKVSGGVGSPDSANTDTEKDAGPDGDGDGDTKESDSEETKAETGDGPGAFASDMR